ncbi:unnamed protein product [Hymenolepis diminuta]|uniref:Uncharacterized protein n=1 Tax=Hymenolepis diminuta TaxID=6216 RepID=A0A564YLL6_HYMDI|nr:unnamed protein product [Hymenolepis diminuta]
MPRVIPERPCSEPMMPKQQAVPTFCLLDHQMNQAYHLREIRKIFLSSASPEPLERLQNFLVSVIILVLSQCSFTALSDRH